METGQLKLIVGNSSTVLSEKIRGEMYEEFKQWLGYEPEDAMWRQQNNPHFKGYITTVCYDEGWCRCAVKKKGMHFPTGLISRACEFFKDRFIDYEIVDERPIWTPGELDLSIATSNPDGTPFSLYEYQKEAINKAIKSQRGIIKIATGGGKSVVLAALIATLSVKPSVVYVTTTDLLLQMANDIKNTINQQGLNIKVGQVGGGKKDIQDITVMTVQTAIRAVGEKYIKNPDDDEAPSNDTTDISDIQKDLFDLIRSAKFVGFDECQHVRAETAQIISDNSLSARWKFGFSATPFRDSGDDILIDACFGKPIVDISASWLIQNKYLVKPFITFVPIRNLEGEKFGDYASTYKNGVVENNYRTEWISKLSQSLSEQERNVLILVQQINHGEMIQSSIPNSVFMHGSSGKKNRESHLQKMKSDKSPITIASSLPYEELLLIKFDGQIRQMEIGNLCENYSEYIKQNRVETLCSKNGKTLSWSQITDTHIHKNTHNLVRVRTNKGEETIVTSNHSLVDADLNMVKPQVGLPACSPQGFDIPQEGITNQINVVELLKNDNTIEVEITGLTQSLVRKLKTENKWYKNPKSISKSSRIAVEKRTANMGSNYFLALDEMFSNFKYYKGKYRASVQKASKCRHISDYFPTKIYCRRSRSLYSLPWKLHLTNELSTVMGLLAAEGHISEQNCKTCKSKYDVVFSGMKNTTDGKYDPHKKNIRQIFIDNVKKSLNWEPSSINDTQIDISGKLSYLFFKNSGVINNNKEKRVPDCIFSATRDNKESFLWGHYLGDGSLLFQNNEISSIKWHTTSRPLYVGLWCLLQMLGHNIRIDITNGNGVNKDKYTILSRNKIKHIVPYVKVNGRDYPNSRRIQKSVEILNRNDTTVYDISVEGCHNFIGGTVLDHNTIFDEGIDCRPLDALILAGGGKSSVRALQRVGRVIRKYTYPDGRKKENAFVYDLHDHLKYLSSHALARKRIYKTEPEFDIREFKG